MQFACGSNLRVLVTRPVAQADEWVGTLCACGIEATALPLIEIRPPADIGAVRAAWVALASQNLVMFVSPNAVDGFFALRPPDSAWPDGLRAASPGPGTSQALLRAGVPAPCIVQPRVDAAQFDSEALWESLAGLDWQGADALIVRADRGRDWLSQRLRERGACVRYLAVYRRAPPVLDAGQQDLLTQACAQPLRHLWLFSSAEAIDNLRGLQSHTDWAQARAIATHSRIAERAEATGFGTVRTCSPELAAVVACIQSLAP